MNRSTLYTALILPILLLVVIRFLAGFDGLYGQDPYEYLRYSQALKEFILTGTSPGDYFWPVWYPLAGALLSLFIPDTGFCLQLISAFSLSIVFIYSIKLIGILFPGKEKNAPLYIGILMILSPFMLRFGFSIMADLLTLATLLMGTYYMVSFIRGRSVFALCMGALLYSISFMSRYAVALLLLPMIIYVAYSFFLHRSKWYFIPFALLAGILPIIPHLLIRGESSVHFVLHDWITNWSPLHFFRNKFITRDGFQAFVFPNIIYSLGGVFHPRYFAAGILFLILGFKKFQWPVELRILLTGLILYLVFLAGIPYQNNRFLLLALPFLLIIFFPPAMHSIQLLGKKIEMVGWFIAGMIQTVLFIFSFKVVWERSRFEKNVFEYCMTLENKTIYTMDIDVSLKGRNYPYPIHNTWTEYYEEVDPNSVIIFNTKVFPQQWAGMNPMKNWEHMNETYELIEIKDFKNGWKVYSIE